MSHTPEQLNYLERGFRFGLLVMIHANPDTPDEVKRHIEAKLLEATCNHELDRMNEILEAVQGAMTPSAMPGENRIQ